MTSHITFLGCALVAGFGLATGAAADTPADPLAAVVAGHPIVELRRRFESVDQTGFSHTAEAYTVRTRLGWETAAWHGLKVLVEAENVQRVGAYRFNDQVHPNPAYPVVADPTVTELNRLQLSWTPSARFTATVGRQRINLDDQRFIGGAAWRQDEQTFDAVTATARFGPVSVTGGYLWRINRVFGQAQDWRSQSWFADATWTVSDALKPQAFVYALDFGNAPAQSTLTWGVRVTGRLRPAPLTLTYGASYARQSDFGDNPASFGLDFWQAEASATWRIATLRADYESLQGNGVRGFATPLATLHAFQGWADVFLTTPANGVRDANLSLILRPGWHVGPVHEFEFTLRGHDFTAERTAADLGSEVDAQVTARFTRRLTGLIKVADYNGVPGFADRTKLWVGFEFRL